MILNRSESNACRAPQEFSFRTSTMSAGGAHWLSMSRFSSRYAPDPIRYPVPEFHCAGLSREYTCAGSTPIASAAFMFENPGFTNRN
jgi:hypothetical protein